MSEVKKPFTPQQVSNLWDYQMGTGKWAAHPMHPFTCGNHGDANHDRSVVPDVLIPTVRGWICPFCDWAQDWAHDFMLE